MTRYATYLALAALLALLMPALATTAVAEEETETVPGPRNLEVETKDAPAAKPEVIPFNPANFELLPLDDVERVRMWREHPTLMTRLTVLGNRAKKLREQYYKRKNKNDAGSKKLTNQIEQLKSNVGRIMAAAKDTLAEYGVTPEVLALLEQAPRDQMYRIERYAHSLVLSIDLEPKQRALFERIVPEVNGAYYSLIAQRRRLDLVAKQTEVDKDRANALRRTFDQQLRWNDKRFWMLVDYVLDEEQRLALKERLPTKFQRIQNGIEHLYQLEGITPSQGARAKSILTEFEAEAAPDQALVKRARSMRGRSDITAADRKRMQTEIKEANERLQDLQLHMARAFKEVLTDKQEALYKGIPPRLSHVDRRRDFRYIFDGMPFSAEQERKIGALRKLHRETQRRMQKEVGEIRRKGTDFGADSPQMEMMNMEMAGVAAKGYALQRKVIGEVFTDILVPDQVSGWLLGYYGKVR